MFYSDLLWPLAETVFSPALLKIHAQDITMIIKHKIKSLLHSYGIDLKRYHAIPPYIHYLRTLKIRTVLDIGASVGDSAVEFRRYFPAALIHSFEPLPESYKTLKTSLRDTNFFPHNIALGEKHADLTFYHNAHAPSSSFLPMLRRHANAFPETASAVKIKIPVQTLNAIYPTLMTAPNVLMKIDVQGFEDRILKGSSKIMQKIVVIIIEVSYVPLYKNQALFDDIYQMLHSRHFRYMGNVHDIRDIKTGMPLQANALFIAERLL
jgi:FkbM family methyltransferase